MNQQQLQLIDYLREENGVRRDQLGPRRRFNDEERKTTWKEFLRPHWALIVAADFLTIEAWRRGGLQRFGIRFFHGIVDSQGEDRRDRVESQWFVDESIRPPIRGLTCTVALELATIQSGLVDYSGN